MKIVILNIILAFCFVTGYSQIKFSDILFVDLPLADSIEQESKTNTLKLTKTDWNEFGFSSFEEFNANFEYSVFGQILTVNFQMLLVERRFIEESIHWICMVDMQSNLVDWIQIAYENSEGFLSRKSMLYKGEIKVTEWNEFSYPNQKVILYLITNKGFSEK